MLFASTSLAARIERADSRLLVDCAEATRRRRGTDVQVLPVGGGVATCAGEDSPLNKVAGLGFAGDLDVGELEAAEEAFLDRGLPVRVELSCLAEPSVGALLTRHGYVLQGFETVLGRPLPADEPPRAGAAIDVQVSGPEGFDTWLDVVVTGFATPDDQGVVSHESYPREALEAVIGDMAAADGFVRYLARRGGEPVGGASMRLFEGVALLCGAATLPAHRRRGVQTAMLAERLREAGDAGCDVAVVTTQPGSKSQENVQRLGFAVLYSRSILVKDA